MQTYNDGNLIDLTDASPEELVQNGVTVDGYQGKSYMDGNLVDLSGVADNELVKMGIKKVDKPKDESLIEMLTDPKNIPSGQNSQDNFSIFMSDTFCNPLNVNNE